MLATILAVAGLVLVAVAVARLAGVDYAMLVVGMALILVAHNLHRTALGAPMGRLESRLRGGPRRSA